MNELFLSRVRESIEKLNLQERKIINVDDERINSILRENTSSKDQTYTGSPNESAKGFAEYKTTIVSVDKLANLVRGHGIVADKLTRSLSNVASGNAQSPFVGWSEDLVTPYVIDGNHRVHSLERLRYKHTTIVCPADRLDEIINWFNVGPSNDEAS